MGGLGSGPRCGTDRLGQYKTTYMRVSVRNGLWRPGRAFFQIGLGCVMSHHQSPHRRALHIPALILAGKFKIEFLPTVGHSKGFPLAPIRPNLHKIVSSCLRAFLVAQIRSKSHKIVSISISCCIICQNTHKIVFSCIRAFLVARIRHNLHTKIFCCMHF